ncbi:MAG: adaptor protein MecA [Clostridiales bacterium]|jgi:adapter protein MecA 1/2|nr:adaptor protein MecA [Clostridiales bacterium]
MKIERVGVNKIKVFMSDKDLEKWDIDLNNLDSNNSKMEELFWHIMRVAEKEISFNFGNSKVCVEAISRKLNGMVMFITKIESEIVGVEQKYKIDQIKKYENNCSSSYIFQFDNFEEVCKAFKTIDGIFFGESALYKYKNFFFAEFVPYTVTNFFNVERFLTEFSCRISLDSKKMKGFLCEQAICMIKKNALENIVMFF